MTMATVFIFLGSENMASRDDIYDTGFDSSMDHTREHLIKLTKNLLDFQQTGMCCDITPQCKDGTVKAHSGITVYAYNSACNHPKKCTVG